MTNSKWTNFNDAADQISYELIPHKTIAKVVMIIKKGGGVSMEWPDGYTTKSKAGTSVYLACEFTILSGPYKNRKIWTNIGLHSDNSPKYGEIGRGMIKAILNSAYGIHSKDKSPEAEKQRQIKSFADLDNLTCVAEITINDKGASPRNEIRTIITPDHPKYSEYMEDRSDNLKINYGTVSNKQSADKIISNELPF